MPYPLLPKVAQKRFIRTALSGVTDIKPLIHRSKFFIQQCSYKEIEERLGKIRVLSLNESREYFKREPGYRKVGFIQRNLGVLTVFFDPEDARWPRFRFHTSQSDRKTLMALYNDLPDYPGLQVSSLEYTIDFFCQSCESVCNLFCLFRRYMFFPYAKSTYMRGDKLWWLDETRVENAVYHIDMGKNHGKIYERGDDDDDFDDRQGWPYENLDRVRLEFTFERNFLKRYQVNDLYSLIRNVKFHQICSPKIQFKNFKASSPFSKDWENYNAVDEDGNNECLMEEIFQAKKEGKYKNPLQYLEDNKMLQPLKILILRKLAKFDKKWRSAYDKRYMLSLKYVYYVYILIF